VINNNIKYRIYGNIYHQLYGIKAPYLAVLMA
jgi:hypothetical protein